MAEDTAPVAPQDEEERPPLWQRQAWDSEASFDAFYNFYLPQPPPRRLIGAYRSWKEAGRGRKGGESGATEKGKSREGGGGAQRSVQKVPGTWAGWANARTKSGKPIPGAVGWEERARAWDKHQDQRAEVARSAAEQARREAVAKEKADMLQRQVRLGRVLQDLVWHDLEALHAQAAHDMAEARKIMEAGGVPPPRKRLFAMDELRHYARLGIEMERQALGLPTELIAIGEMTNDELLAAERQLIAEIAAIVGDPGGPEGEGV